LKRYGFCHSFGVAPAMFVGMCVMGSAALGQTTSAEIPADCSAYASVPLPAEAEQATPKTFPVCASYRSYRGIGRPNNYSESRACAWQERLAQKADLGQNPKALTAWVVGGSLILADIYVNGAGIKRNIPLAMRLACESEEGMVKLAAPAITKLSGSPRGVRPFEFCEYATLTFMMSFCSAYASEIEDERRSRYFDSLKTSMTPEQLAAFETLVSAQSAYVDAHASEVDQGGTIRSMRTTGSMSILRDLFRTKVVHFERKKWPAFSEKEITSADGWLEREYRKKLWQLRTHTKDEINLGAVTADHVSGVQETWRAYRDAWVTFARLRYPAAAAVIRTEITLERYRLLKTIW
jgi:hypothetical protein